MHPYVKEWMVFLFGTPKRVIVTAVVMSILVLAINPALGTTLVSNLLIVLTPLFQLVVVALIMWFGVKLMFKGGGGSKGNKK